MVGLGVFLFLAGLLIVLGGGIWLLAAAIQKESKKLAVTFVSGGVAALCLGVVMLGLGESMSRSPNISVTAPANDTGTATNGLCP